MGESRTFNTRRNLISGLMKQAQMIILPFVIRTIVLYTLGVEYQGLSSLFSSLLQVLNLADLGFSSAVVYILYGPIAREDWDAVRAIIAYLRRVYTIVGSVILAIGLCLMPFLRGLISGTYPQNLNIYALYAIYLINTVLSYWLFAYKSALLTAMQREDLVSKIYTLTNFGLKAVQIVLLLVLSNYYLYVALMPVFTLVNNLLLQVVSKRKFPDLMPQGQIDPQTRRELTRQVKGVFINRVGDVARNGCDSIFLSAFMGLATLAIYDNYFYIYTALYGITLAITRAIQASVGNSVAKETVDKNYRDLRRFTFLFSWFTGWCTVCLCCLYQPFMLIWMKGNTEMLFSVGNMLLVCLYFYGITMNNMRNMYVNAAGLFWQLRMWYIIEAAANIVLNAVLGYFFGVTGIILATILTVFVCNFITRTNVLFRCYFRRSAKEFYRQHGLHFAVMAVGCAVTYGLCSLISVPGIPGLLLYFVVCLIVPNGIFLLAYCRTEMFRDGVQFVRSVLKK